jgi:hypothetical protein
MTFSSMSRGSGSRETARAMAMSMQRCAHLLTPAVRRLGNRLLSRQGPPCRSITFEDFSTGWTAEYGPRRVTREEIIGFAAQFDPQPMHLDEEAARNTMLGGLGASGWHTCCIMMKMIADGCCSIPPRWARPASTR